MSLVALIETARALVADDKGLLAIDESNTTCNQRFTTAGIPQTDTARQSWRELIVTTPGLNESISGVILLDETLRQKKVDGTPLLQVLMEEGILPGIKVDLGTKDMTGHPGEKITEGLNGLRKRLQEYARMGARFAKWRAVIAIGPGLPSRACLEANALALARYAALCQEAGLVPIIEPDILMEGSHPLARCAEVTEETLHTVFAQLNEQRVLLEGMILKANMIIWGATHPKQEEVAAVADATMKCLLSSVPAAVPGIVFLSGGQLASERINAMNALVHGSAPWALSVIFARAIQQPALAAWRGQEAQSALAQDALYYRTRSNRAARGSLYSEAIRPQP